MKILFFSDIHFHHSHTFSRLTQEGFSIRELEHISCADTIIKICKEEKIDKIVFGGDMFGPVGDNMSGQTLSAICIFFEKLQSLNIPIDILVGNHDLSFSTNSTHIHKLVAFKNWQNLKIYDEPYEINKIVYMPYCTDNQYAQQFLENIVEKDKKIIFSHLEIKGINLGNGIFTEKGVELDLLKQFRMVLQGHYHSGGSLAKNIQIVGSTQRLSFKDKGIARNNIILYDTDSNKIERRSFECPDWLTFTDDNINDLLKLDTNNYVKVEVSMDILLTEEIKNKLETFKGKDVHIDLTRLVVNRNIENEITSENEIDVLSQFINKSDNTEEQKEALIKEGHRLVEKVKDK